MLFDRGKAGPTGSYGANDLPGRAELPDAKLPAKTIIANGKTDRPARGVSTDMNAEGVLAHSPGSR